MVVDKFINELNLQLKERDVVLELEESARLWLADKGYDPAQGARPLARVIQRELKDHLAEEILFGKLCKGGHVRISLPENATELQFSFTNPK